MDENKGISRIEFDDAMADRRAAIKLIESVLRSDPGSFFERVDQIFATRGSLEGVVMAQSTIVVALIQLLAEANGEPSEAVMAEIVQRLAADTEVRRAPE